MKTISITLFLFFSSLIYCKACTCGGSPSFCTSSHYALGILEVEVTQKYQNADFEYKRFIDLKVKRTLASRDSVQYGNLTLVEGVSFCGILLYNKLRPGDRLFINYNSVYQEPGAKYPSIWFSICSINFLRVEGNTVRGKITDDHEFKEQTMTVAQFRKNAHQLCNFEILDENAIRVINNISQNSIDLKNNHTTPLNIELYSSAGQLIYKNAFGPDEELSIDFIDFPSDIYFLRFRNSFSQITIKTVKVR